MEDKEEAPQAPQELTEQQRDRIQKNKQRAQGLKELRKRSKPYERHDTACTTGSSVMTKNTHQAQVPPALRNSHAGFIFDEEDCLTQQHKYQRVEEEGKWICLSFPTQ